MTFEEHLENHCNADGSYDLAGAEADRAADLAQSPDELDRMAAKTAHQERTNWEKQNNQHLGKQLSQPALSAALELDAMVQVGRSTVFRLGEMNHDRIRLRKDVRTKVHVDESRAYVTEMDFWEQTERLLDDGETIAEAIDRSAP